MTIATRRRIFYALTLVFLVIGAGAVLYAQGWRLDAENLVPQRVGGLYVETLPRDSSITLDGTVLKRPFTIFDSGFLLNNLYPKNHTLVIAQAGYESWARTVRVAPALVVNVRAILVPSTSTVVAAHTTSYWLHEGAVTRTTATGTIVFNGHPLPTGLTVVDISPDGSRLIGQDQKTKRYMVFGNTTTTTIPLAPLFARLAIPANATPLFDKADNARLVASTRTTITLVDLIRDGATQLVTTANISSTETIATIASERSWISWSLHDELRDTSRIFIYDRSANRTIALDSHIPGKINIMRWLTPTLMALLTNEKALYLYDVDKNALTSRADGVKDFAFNRERNVLAALSDKSIEVFSLRRDDYSRFTLPQNEKITRLEWYRDGTYLFAFYNDHTAFFEFADRALENIREIQGSQGWYDPEQNSLFFIDKERNLRTLVFPS